MENEAHRSAQEKIDHIDKLLQYMDDQLVTFKKNQDLIDTVQKYVEYDRSIIEKLGPEECDFICYDLARYMFYLNSVLARSKAKINFIEAEIKRALGHFMEREYHGIFGAENKKITAIAEDPYCSYLNDKLMHTNLYYDRLNNLNFGLNGIREEVKSIKISKLARQKQE